MTIHLALILTKARPVIISLGMLKIVHILEINLQEIKLEEKIISMLQIKTLKVQID